MYYSLGEEPHSQNSFSLISSKNLKFHLSLNWSNKHFIHGKQPTSFYRKQLLLHKITEIDSPPKNNFMDAKTNLKISEKKIHHKVIIIPMVFQLQMLI